MSVFPFSVREYSTVGGIVLYCFRLISPSFSSSRRSFVSMVDIPYGVSILEKCQKWKKSKIYHRISEGAMEIKRKRYLEQLISRMDNALGSFEEVNDRLGQSSGCPGRF